MQTPDDVLKAELEAMDKVFEVESAKSPFFAQGARVTAGFR